MALVWRGGVVEKRLLNTARKRVREAAMLVATTVKLSMVRGGRTASGVLETVDGKRREPGTGKKAEKINTYRSKPGEVPRVQTGRLRGSITHEVHPTLPISRAGTNVVYGRKLELGDKRVAPRPFMRPALHKSEATIREIFTRRIEGE